MPVDIERLDDEDNSILDIAEGTQPYRVLEFLAENDDKAYTQTEISDETGIKRSSVGAVLHRLEKRSLVRHEGRYWGIADDERLASYVAQTKASSSSTNDDYYGEDDVQ